MGTSDNNFSIVVFPFLKTSGPVPIGQQAFRSTDDTVNLSSEQATCLNEICGMLFLQDNLRIESSSYAIVPFIDFKNSTTLLEHLMNVQSVVAYIYASPRHEFGDLFLSSEHASMAIFSPGKVSKYLLRPDFHVNNVGPEPILETNNREEADGYMGVYNFRHHFWVTKDSRLYGPKPHLTLNHSQNLLNDHTSAVGGRADYRLLNALLKKSVTQTSSRIFTAVRWFNSACNEANDESAAMVNLSIAFEALLGLPTEKKTDRFIDAISLLLGRTPRLDIWAHQFYNVRSRIVHEGYTQNFHFIATDSIKKNDSQSYQSLLSYGRQIFQLCLGTILSGAELAEKYCIEDKLITNQERFQEICKVLSDTTIGARERLECIESIVANIQKYRYVPESNLNFETMIGAIRLATNAMLQTDDGSTPDFKTRLERFINAKKNSDHFQEFEALQEINSIYDDRSLQDRNTYAYVFRDLVKAVWHYVFMHYFWLKKKKERSTDE